MPLVVWLHRAVAEISVVRVDHKQDERSLEAHLNKAGIAHPPGRLLLAATTRVACLPVEHRLGVMTIL